MHHASIYKKTGIIESFHHPVMLPKSDLDRRSGIGGVGPPSRDDRAPFVCALDVDERREAPRDALGNAFKVLAPGESFRSEARGASQQKDR